MGNELQNQNNASNLFNIQIHLPKLNYFPGEIIQGSITLLSIGKNNDIQDSLPKMKILQSIIQKEYWKNGQNSTPLNLDNDINNDTPIPQNYNTLQTENDTSDIKHTNIKTITNQILLITKNSYSKIENGFEIPFQLEIPKNALPSFEWFHDVNTFCYSRIFLNIEIPETQNKKSIILFIEKQSLILNTPLIFNKFIGKKSFIIFGGDSLQMEVSYPKNSYSFNDICCLHLKIDITESKTKLNSVIIFLKRKIKFLVNGKQSIFLNTADFMEDIWENKIMIKDDKNLIKNYDFNLILTDNEKLLSKRQTNFLLLENNKNILKYLMPSFSGQNICCEYFIKIKPIFESSSFSYSDFLIPLDLYHENDMNMLNILKDINKILSDFNNLEYDIKNCNRNSFASGLSLNGSVREYPSESEIYNNQINTSTYSHNKPPAVPIKKDN